MEAAIAHNYAPPHTAQEISTLCHNQDPLVGYPGLILNLLDAFEF